MALLLTLAAEVLFDVGVLIALIIGAIALFAKHDALAAIMPIAGFFAIDPQWSRTTIFLYAGFVVLAIIAGFIGRRRPPFISAAVGLLILLIEMIRR